MDRAITTGSDDVRDSLAAERTLLAWIRTGLALMGLGFVVARFGSFLLGLALATSMISLRASTHLQARISQERTMTHDTHEGIIDTLSHHSVDQTVATLQTMLQSKGVTLFAVIDHSGEAEKVGLTMPPTKLLIFGSPKAGTPLMLAAPSAAIDLPLKILVRQDAGGSVWISYNSPQYLQQRHAFPAELLSTISVVETLAAKAAQ